MSNITDKEVDKLFKQAAEGFQEPYDEAMWSDMNTRLSAGGGELSFYKTVGAALVGIMATVAVILMLQSALPSQKSLLNADEQNEGQLEPIARIDQNESKEVDIEVSRIDEENRQQASKSFDNLPFKTAQNTGEVQRTAPVHLSNDPFQHVVDKSSKHIGQKKQGPKLLNGLKAPTDYTHFELKRNLLLVDDELIADEKENTLKPAFAIKASYAADLSSVGYFNPDNPGSTFGLLGEYHFANRWFVSIGALLSHKIYYSNDAEATAGYGYPTDRLDAECKVIDIPINLGYYLFKNKKQGFYITGGVSSYLMLSEDYVFESTDYLGNSEAWEQHYENENNHFFGIVNLSIGYEHQLMPKIYVQLEPYLKAPIAGVGEGKVDLVSSGAMIHFKYAFKTKKDL